MDLGRQAFSSAFLLLLRKTWGNIVNLLVMAFLARVLSREDFGIVAISNVFLTLINTLATSGISEYIVYYDGVDLKNRLNAAFWLNLILTAAVVGLVFALGPLWSSFYEDQRIFNMLLLLTISFCFEMGSTIPKAILRKDLVYKPIVLYSGIAMTFISVGKVISAWLGLGVYSLVVPQAIVSPFLMLALFVRTNWRPYAKIGSEYFKDIFAYTKHVVGGRVLTRLVNDGDNLIVGKFVGLEGLGIYSLAFQLANLVTTNIVFLANDVVLPVLSKVKNDSSRLKDVYLRVLNLLGFVTFPLIVALILASSGIVNIIYGSKWMDAVLPLQILCIFALSRSINSPTSLLFNAKGKPDVNFKFSSYFTPFFLLSVYIGSLFGVTGVALATTLTRFGGAFVLGRLALNLIGVSWRAAWVQFKYILISSGITFCAFSFLFFPFSYRDWVSLALIPFIIYFNLLVYRYLFRPKMIELLDSLGGLVRWKNLLIFCNRLFFIRG